MDDDLACPGVPWERRRCGTFLVLYMIHTSQGRLNISNSTALLTQPDFPMIGALPTQRPVTEEMIPMQRRDFLKSTVAVALAAELGMGKAQAKVAAHNWINYDFGPGPHSRIEDLVRFPLGEQLYIPPTWREVQFFASSCPRNSETPNRERTMAADGWG
jgi:hypothetical protein